MMLLSPCVVLAVSLALQGPPASAPEQGAGTAPAVSSGQETPPVVPLVAHPATVPPASTTYVPPTGRERLRWAVASTFGPRAEGGGLLSATWFTGWNNPHEWGNGARGFVTRLGSRQVSVGIANALEASAGSLWGEDPRYPRSDSDIRERVRNAFRCVFMTRARDGHLRFGYARVIAIVGSNTIAHAWLPPSGRTWGGTLERVGYSYLARLAVNAFLEFWPDIRHYVFKRPPKPQPPDKQP